MTRHPLFYAALGLITVFLLNSTLFIVREYEQVLVLQLGEPKRIIRTAGLHAKWPMLQQAQYFDKRMLDVDPKPERVLLANDRGSLASLVAVAASVTVKTPDGQPAAPAKEVAYDPFNRDDSSVNGLPIMVDTFARYRITDPLKFRQRLSTEEAAELRLTNEIDSTTRDVLGRATLEQLLSSDRVKLMQNIKQRVNDQVKNFGIEIVDVRIGRADLTANLKESTFNRMQSERAQRAAEIRSFGEKRALEIRSSAEKERTVLLAEAHRDANILRGQGDAESGAIYNQAYNQDSDFYQFYRSLDAYRSAFENDKGEKETTFLLSPKSDFLKYFENYK